MVNEDNKVVGVESSIIINKQKSQIHDVTSSEVVDIASDMVSHIGLVISNAYSQPNDKYNLECHILPWNRETIA